jgi:glycosyltransferase involved in cell wall biosynthesis
MASVVILQRVVPSYRLPVFRRIHAELGWPVAYGKTLDGMQMHLEKDEPFLHGFEFRMRGKRPTQVEVPIDEILERFHPQAIVAEGALGMSSTWELLARRWSRRGPKVFFWTIGYHPERPRYGVRGLISQAPYLAAYAGADGCILYGEDGRDLLRKVFPRKPLFVAHNTIDVDEIRRFRDSAPAYPRRGWPELVSIGRMIKEKDFPILVEAFLLIKRRFPEARLTIIGDGPDRAAVELAAGAEIGRSIILPGASYNEAETARVMVAADAFVMGGRIGLSINHALAYDMPVIAFARASDGPHHGSEIASLINGITGQVVPEHNACSMANTVVELFTRYPEPKAAFQASIRKFVDDRLTIDRMVDGFQALNRHLDRL